MFFSTGSPHQATTPRGKSIFKTEKLRRVANKIMQKLKLSKVKDDKHAEKPETRETRFLTLTRPTEAPRIIDLQAMKRSIISPQITPIHVSRSSVSRSGAELVRPGLRLQTSFKASLSSTDMSTPLLEDPQPVSTSEETLGRSFAATLDDVEDYKGYEILDDGDEDVDWALLDLPEPVLRRLVNESRHSLI